MDQVLHLAQSLRLSPAQLQSMKLLQMGILELSAYIKESMEENPMLEEDPVASQETWEQAKAQMPWLEPHSGGQGIDPSLLENMPSPQEDNRRFFLQTQLLRKGLSIQIQSLSSYLIDSLDEHGYLCQEDLQDLQRAGIPQELLCQAVSALHSLDPPGIAARSLSECLTLQLSRLPGDHSLAIAIASRHLDALAKGRYSAIARAECVSVELVRLAQEEIQALNPYPGGEPGSVSPIAYIWPDAWIFSTDGQLQVVCNQWDIPALQLSQEYLRMLQNQPDPEVKAYLAQKWRQAQWLMQAISRRQSTLTACFTAIAAQQARYFLGETPVPVPMTQAELARQLSLHPSTVSRALRNKYLQCRQGLLPLSDFFFRQVGQGPIALSGPMIKTEIVRLIDKENSLSPLSDQELSDLLLLKGIRVARRTVTKYRMELGLPSSYDRGLQR